MNDKWFRTRSDLNHAELGNKLRLILTDDNLFYVECAIKGEAGNDFDSETKKYYERIKTSLKEWKDIRNNLIYHAKNIHTEFNPCGNGLSFLASFLNSDDLEWLSNVNSATNNKQFKYDLWLNDVINSIQKVDDAISSIKHDTSGIMDMRDAVDDLIKIYSGRGYFNYAEGN